jgi:hypothetical protein
VEHVDQPAANAGFDLSPVTGDLHFSVSIPGVAKASRPVEGQPIRGHPLDLEWLSKCLGRAWTRGLVAFA